MFRLMKWLRARWGYDKYSAETFDRLMYSAHVEDLRGIAHIALWLALITVVGAIAVASYDIRAQGFAEAELYKALIPLCIAVLVGLGGIIAWCYQTGSARLGVVDLFACEITTVCRISTINRMVDSCITAFHPTVGATNTSEHDTIMTSRKRFKHFDSAELYTPIFDGNAKELRSLSVKVVNNITAFYTYWKASRDAFRKLAHADPAAVPDTPASARSDPWHKAMRDVIYMQFLASESARRAVRGLIEFEPNSAENTITILLSELPAYGFLMHCFQDNDDRHARLKSRQAQYETVVRDVYYYAVDEHEKYADIDTARRRFPGAPQSKLQELCRDWDKAYGMLTELQRRYIAVFGAFPPRAGQQRS